MNHVNAMHAYSYNTTANPSAENQFLTCARAALRKTNHTTSQSRDQNRADSSQTEQRAQRSAVLHPATRRRHGGNAASPARLALKKTNMI